MKYEVIIPYWCDGVPLTVGNIEAASGHLAWMQVIEWVNRRAGRHYCNDLPLGTKLVLPDGSTLTHERGLFDVKLYAPIAHTPEQPPAGGADAAS